MLNFSLNQQTLKTFCLYMKFMKNELLFMRYFEQCVA